MITTAKMWIRDRFLDAYYDAKIFENDPFAKLDQTGVGKLMEMAIELGKPVNPSLHVGICGEHGGDVYKRQVRISPIAVKRTSVDEFSAVSQESWITPTMNPTPTTCIATSFGIPKRLQASGIRRSDPPATPEAPAALAAERTHRISAVGKSTWISSVCAAASAIVEIVIAAPAILIVAPSGMEME